MRRFDRGCASSRVAHLETDRPSSPCRLEEPSSPSYPPLTSRFAPQAPPLGSKPAGSSGPARSSCPEVNDAVLTRGARDASPRLGEELGVDIPRRLSSCAAECTRTLAGLRSSRPRLALLDEARAATAHRFTSANPAMRVNATLRASLWLRHPRGKLAPCGDGPPVSATMRAADECHPRPDQLHPCSSFPRFPRIALRRAGAQEIDAFHDAFDRFGGRSCSVRVEALRSRGLVPLRLSRFVAFLRRGLRIFERAAVAWEQDQDRLLRAPVKETRGAAVENEFRRCAPELSGFFRDRGFAATLLEERFLSLAAAPAASPLRDGWRRFTTAG